MVSISILLVIPPLTQLNTPYPSTAYLTGFLRSRGYEANQADVGIEMVLALFSRAGLSRVFTELQSRNPEDLPGEARQMLSMAKAYIETIEPVVAFLQGRDTTFATRIGQGGFLPQGPRFAAYESEDPSGGDHVGDQTDHAKHLATLYLEDLADLVQATVAPQFALSRYAESVGMGATSYDGLAEALVAPPSMTDTWMLEALWSHVERVNPTVVGFTVPFPGNVYGALRMAQAVKGKYPEIQTILGGGYVNTELRRLRDPRVFEIVDYITLDDGERPLLNLLEYLEGQRSDKALCRTFQIDQGQVEWCDGAKDKDFTMREIGTPTYDGLNLGQYLSVLDTLNPMHHLWSDGHWNKLTVAHGCYWKQCTFCDVGLDYIGRYEATPTDILTDRIEALIAETGRRGFHFVDEAAPPAGLKQLALSLLERGVTISWWGNVRFEPAFTPDLCRLLAASGCIALSAGLEAACDRLLAEVKKGITLEQTVRVVESCQQAGILVHAYLMYGLPGETIPETVESLERVRQLFAYGLIQSAFWHRFSTTAHSPIGLHPQAHGIRILGPTFGGFAENDLVHEDEIGAAPEWLGDGLRAALAQYKEGAALDEDVRMWFAQPVPRPTVSRHWVKQILRGKRPEDPSFMERRCVWIGGTPVVDEHKGNRCRIILPNRTKDETLMLSRAQTDWLVHLIHQSTPVRRPGGHHYPTFKTIHAEFPGGGPSKFSTFWRSGAMKTVRDVGLVLV
jgi:hypothetical protein